MRYVQLCGNKVSKVYVKCDDDKAGLLRMGMDYFGNEHNWVHFTVTTEMFHIVKISVMSLLMVRKKSPQ